MMLMMIDDEGNNADDTVLSGPRRVMRSSKQCHALLPSMCFGPVGS